MREELLIANRPHERLAVLHDVVGRVKTQEMSRTRQENCPLDKLNKLDPAFTPRKLVSGLERQPLRKDAREPMEILKVLFVAQAEPRLRNRLSTCARRSGIVIVPTVSTPRDRSARSTPSDAMVQRWREREGGGGVAGHVGSAMPEAPSADVLLEMLDRVDRWIAAGLLGGEQPNAADFKIAPSLSL